MYAIINTGGKQVKVEQGQTIYIEKLDAQEGDKVTFEEVVSLQFLDCLFIFFISFIKSFSI